MNRSGKECWNEMNNEETAEKEMSPGSSDFGKGLRDFLNPVSRVSSHISCDLEKEKNLIFCTLTNKCRKNSVFADASGKLYHSDLWVWEYAEGEVVGLITDGQMVYDILMKADTALFYNLRGKYASGELFYLYHTYLSLKPEQRQHIRSCMSLSNSLENDVPLRIQTCFFRGVEEWKVKFELTRNSYPPETRTYIEALFSQRKESPFGKGNAEIDERLKYLVNISCYYPYAVSFQRKKLLEVLNERIIGLDAVKKSFCDVLNADLVYRKKRSCVSFLLVGAAGTAKTTFARLLSESIGIPFFTISCAGISTAIPFVGDEAAFEHSSPSELVKKMYQYGGTSECVILLDEIDKMAQGHKEGDPYMALLDMLGESRHYDRYLEASVDMHRSIVICTANDEADIPEVLLQRFAHVFHFPPYTNEEKAVIGAEKVKELLQNYQLNKITLTDQALHRIAWYTDDDGMRKYNACVQKVIISILAEGVTEGEIKETDIDRYLMEEQAVCGCRMLFKRKESSYAPEIKEEIRKTFLYLESRKCDVRSIPKYEEKLNLLCKLYAKPESDTFEVHAIQKMLMKSHFGMEKVKRQISRLLCSYAVTGKISGGRILLQGKAGVGKTSMTKAIAEALNRPLVEINLNGMERPEVLKGFPMTYIDAAPGMLVREICKAGTHCVVCLDEMEKCSLSVQNALVDLLDSSNHFVDFFLGTGLDLSETIFIATVNDAGLVTAPLRNRFYEIALGDYTLEEKFQIARNYILPKLLDRYSLDNERIRFEDDALRLLVHSCANSTGVREIERELENYLLDMMLCCQEVSSHVEKCTYIKMQRFLDENSSDCRKSIGFV